MDFGEKIMNIRKQNGLSQEEFGNRIDVSRQAISKWETMQSQPEISQVKRISQEFNVSIEYLLNDEIEDPKDVVKKPYIINIKKIVKIVLLVILALYLITSLYKLVVLSIYKNKINKISDYKEYMISTDWVIRDKELEEVNSLYEYNMYAEGVQFLEFNNREKDIPAEITFVSEDTKEVYILDYDDELEKYILDDEWQNNEDLVENIYEQTKIKDIAKEFFPNNIFLVAINPLMTVSFKNNSLCIKQRFSDGENKGEIAVKYDKDTGRLLEETSETPQAKMKITYNYETDMAMDKESLINAFDLNDYDYVLASEVYKDEE